MDSEKELAEKFARHVEMFGMEPFQRARLADYNEGLLKLCREDENVAFHVAWDEQLCELGLKEIWLNDKYQVSLYREEPGVIPEHRPRMIHLSIKRIDKEPIRDWRDLQAIKNQIVSPQHEAAELFPAEDRLVDLANQFHLWVIEDPNCRFPFGFNERMVGTPEEATAIGAKQRKGAGMKTALVAVALLVACALSGCSSSNKGARLEGPKERYKSESSEQTPSETHTGNTAKFRSPIDDATGASGASDMFEMMNMIFDGKKGGD